MAEYGSNTSAAHLTGFFFHLKTHHFVICQGVKLTRDIYKFNMEEIEIIYIHYVFQIPWVNDTVCDAKACTTGIKRHDILSVPKIGLFAFVEELIARKHLFIFLINHRKSDTCQFNASITNDNTSLVHFHMLNYARHHQYTQSFTQLV